MFIWLAGDKIDMSIMQERFASNGGSFMIDYI